VKTVARIRAAWAPPLPLSSRSAYVWWAVARTRSIFRHDVDAELVALEREFVEQVRGRLGRPGVPLAWAVVWVDRAWFALQRWWWAPR
jgi:hypothetical protein